MIYFRLLVLNDEIKPTVNRSENHFTKCYKRNILLGDPIDISTTERSDELVNANSIKNSQRCRVARATMITFKCLGNYNMLMFYFVTLLLHFWYH